MKYAKSIIVAYTASVYFVFGHCQVFCQAPELFEQRKSDAAVFYARINDPQDPTFEESLRGNDPALAISQMWLEVLRVSRRNARNLTDGVNLVGFDVAEASRFLGHIEGRLKLPVPPYWAQCVLSGAISIDGSLLDFPVWIISPYNSEDKRLNRAWQVEELTNSLVIRVPKEHVNPFGGEVRVPIDLVRSENASENQPPTAVSGITFSNERVYFALQNSEGYLIVALKRSAAARFEIDWTAPINSFVPRAGSGSYFTELTADPKNVYAFSCSGTAVVIDRLDPNHGKTTRIFSSETELDGNRRSR